MHSEAIDITSYKASRRARAGMLGRYMPWHEARRKFQ